MKFEVKNRYSGEIQFTAEITCDKDASTSFKLGLAVRWAIENRANLRYANLSSADLRYANLSSADLSYADLNNADLSSADLRYANLSSADLSYADLNNADLRYADLSYADLRYAAVKAISFTGVGKEKRTGYAAMEGKEIIVRLGCFRGTEKEALTAIKKKYGRGSAYEMIVKGACKQLKENEK